MIKAMLKPMLALAMIVAMAQTSQAGPGASPGGIAVQYLVSFGDYSVQTIEKLGDTYYGLVCKLAKKDKKLAYKAAKTYCAALKVIADSRIASITVYAKAAAKTYPSSASKINAAAACAKKEIREAYCYYCSYLDGACSTSTATKK